MSSFCLLSERTTYFVGFKLGGGYLGSGAQPQLFEDLANVVCDRVLGDGELLGDPAVGKPPPDEERHLLLAGGEPFGRGSCSGTVTSVGGSCSSSSSERAYSMARSSASAFPSAHAPGQASSSSCERASFRRPS